MYMNMNWDTLIRSLHNDISVEEELALNEWLASSNKHKQLFNQLKQQQIGLDNLASKDEQEQQWQLLQQRLKAVPVKQMQWQKWFKIVAATAAAVLVFFISKTYMHQATAGTHTNSIVKIASTDNQRKKLVLPDGTTVWLHYQSALQFDSLTFNKQKREVSLTGDAFFDVAKNKQKPFIIKTESLNVNVVGTSFSVFARHNEVQQIKVATGIVTITGSNMNEHLYAGNALSYNMLTQQMVRGNINISEASALKENQLFFEKDSLTSIAQKLQYWYHKKVVVAKAEKIAKPVSFTGIVQDDGIEMVLDGLSYVAGFTYTIHANEIIIYPQH